MRKALVTWLMGISAMSVLSVSAQTAASAIESKKQTLYSSVNHASTPYRIPAVATLNNGTVLAIADQRPCGADVGNGEVDIYAKVGTIAANGTYSWNPSSTDPSANGGLKIADGTSSNGYGDAAVVVDRESGKVLVICVSGKVVFSSGSSSKHNKMARIIGSADGLSWQSPEDVTSQFFANELSSAYTMFMASGRMIQSQHVKVGDYYRIYGVLLVREKSGWFSKSNNNYVVYSDDFGASWKVLGGTYCLKGGDEAKVEELPNGDLVISSRTSGGRYFNVFKFTNLNSASGSWGSATKYSFGGSNSTNGELMLYKGLVDANGTAYNVMLQSLPTGSSRSNVAVFYKAFAADKSSWAVSDFTSGWTKGIEVDNGASGYSTMTILPNGQIGFLYEDDYDTSKASGDYSNIVYVPLTAEEITGGAYNDNDNEEPVVPVAPEFSLSATTATLTAGQTTQLTVSTNSTGAVTYKSSNTAVATVDSKGVVTAVAAGTATITASVAATEAHTAASATCAVTVESAPVVEPEEPETPVEPEEPETPVIDAALQQAIDDAKAIAAYSGVGYPSATAATRIALENTIAKAEAGNATASDLSAAVNAFKSETSDIQMPEDGMTYTFANVAMDGTKRYFKYASSGITAVTSATSATEFTCEAIGNNEYAFVTDGGQYLIWKGPSGSEGFLFWKKTYGYNSNKGYVTSYNSTYCDLIVEKLTDGGTVSANNDAELFGLMCIKGWRYSRSEYGYFTLKGSTFDASATPYYNSTYSSAFLIEDTGTAAKARTRDAEDTTAIEEVEAEAAPVAPTTDYIYDLMGRRVTEMQPGRMYIVNGKKTINVER